MARFEYTHDTPILEGFYQYKIYINTPAFIGRVQCNNGKIQVRFCGRNEYEDVTGYTGLWYGPYAPLNELHVNVFG